MFVGIDLAWTSGRTGLALLDTEGALVTSTTVTTYAEILGWLDAAPRPLVVAVDAPLVVSNARGQRDCERELTAAFRRFKAGTHPSHRGRPGMDPPRAARVAAAQGWSTTARRGTPDLPACIEVYPHPAMVALFGLAERLPYKDKAAFSLAVRQQAFADLLDHLEAIAELRLPGHARWEHLRDSVAAATRRVDLNRVEDEVDAILCAHLAWLWQSSPAALRVYGDPLDGFIVAPPPPG